MKPGNQRVGLDACSTTPSGSGYTCRPCMDADGIDVYVLTPLVDLAQGMHTPAGDVAE